MFKFDGNRYCMIHCRPNSDVVQVTSNISDEVVANMMADELRKQGGYVFRVVPANVLIAALELIKKPQEPDSANESPVVYDDDKGTFSIRNPLSSPYEYGRRAAMEGRRRILACPDNDEQEREWLRGYDSVRDKAVVDFFAAPERMNCAEDT